MSSANHAPDSVSDSVVDLRPTKRLPKSPKINSAGDIELALAELGWLDQVEDEASARADAAKAQIVDKVNRQIVSDVGKIDERRQQLETAVGEYVRANRSDVFDGSKKTVEFANGKVKLIGQRPRVVLAENKSETEVVAEAKAHFNFAGVIEKALDVVVKSINLATFFRVEIKLNKVDIIKAATERPDMAKKFAKLGVSVEQPDDKVKIEPTATRTLAKTA